MTAIYSYIKAVDEYTEYTLRGPDSIDAPGITELATIDGATYVAVHDGVELPEQLPQIAASVQPVVLTPELRERIKAASPQCRLIAQRVIDKIRARYPADEEHYLTRIAVGQLSGLYTPSAAEIAEVQALGTFVEEVRQWGRQQRAELGL